MHGPPLSVRWLSQGMADAPRHDDWLTPIERSWLERMRFPKRRSEFRLGRWTAKRAIALVLGRRDDPSGLRALEIGRAPDGAPAPLLEGLPAPVSLSMTDRADQAVAIVGPPGLGLGCDLELVEPRSDAFMADFLTSDERAHVAVGADDAQRCARANLIWSAKESALKVLRTGLRRDTRSVVVSFPTTGDAGDWSPLSVTPIEGQPLPGWWRRFSSFLVTVCASEPIAPPESLVEPPGLATAAPAHAWWDEMQGPAAS
jgi:4'-phosphopantetheinyl transferase